METTGTGAQDASDGLMKAVFKCVAMSNVFRFQFWSLEERAKGEGLRCLACLRFGYCVAPLCSVTITEDRECLPIVTVYNDK